jgi:pyrimidine-nucleoside phosphorylase
MRTVELLAAVRDQAALPAGAMADFIAGICSGEVPDYQATAFLMAVRLQGLADADTLALTLAMRDSGVRIDLGHVAQAKVDKHSTGGVGDKISLPLAPLVAACGVAVPMVSGRGLGHTGGTVDKLESIPGFRTVVTPEFFRRTVASLGVCMMAQTQAFAPADKKLYALRDVTATVESVPLIASSILAKKLAEGIDALLLDVKVGRGAFMKDLPQARALARQLVRIGNLAGLRVRALLTRMDVPLGRSIGNALEVRECIDILHCRGPADTTELTVCLAAHMLVLGGKAADVEAGRALATAALHSGAARQKFYDLVAAQGGNPAVVDHPDLLPTAAYQTPVFATEEGFVCDIDAYALAMTAMRLGAGRQTASDPVDPAVGLHLAVQRGSLVQRGQALATVHHSGPLQPQVLDDVHRSVQLGSTAPPPQALILESID